MENFKCILLSDIQCCERLRPIECVLFCLFFVFGLTIIRSHPQHTLYDGCLLESASVKIDNNKTMVNVCESCYGDLMKNDQCPLHYLLGNNLWIGQIPWELQSLSLPEQLLVLLTYPRVYVFKLFPKKRGCYSLDQLQSGMRGNVVSYEQDIQVIESMIEGRLMADAKACLDFGIFIVNHFRGGRSLLQLSLAVVAVVGFCGPSKSCLVVIGENQVHTKFCQHLHTHFWLPLTGYDR